MFAHYHRRKIKAYVPTCRSSLLAMALGRWAIGCAYRMPAALAAFPWRLNPDTHMCYAISVHVLDHSVVEIILDPSSTASLRAHVQRRDSKHIPVKLHLER